MMMRKVLLVGVAAAALGPMMASSAQALEVSGEVAVSAICSSEVVSSEVISSVCV